MVSFNRTHQAQPNGTSPSSSRLEFVRALRALGAKTALEGHATRTTHPRSYRVLLNCAYEDWTRMLGGRSIATDHHDCYGRLAFQAWLHRCSDGLVLCIGRRYRRSDGRHWITVTKLYFY